MTDPSFTLGIEEEYLLVDRDSLDLAAAPEGLMEACRADLAGQVSPEFLQCQIEIGTGVCDSIATARDDLRRLRTTVARHAAQHGLAPIAVSCHPFADWHTQHHTDKDRYNSLRRDLGGVARRMLICGMHVHVGIEDREARIDIMNQLTYFLPHLLAMSASSPFWQGEDTGLASYRLTVFDNLPRTGLPPRLLDWSDYQRNVQALSDLQLIEDGTKIWWDLRPSARFPTLETRICDLPSRLEMTLALAGLIQSIARMLWRLRERNQRWRIYDNFLVGENRWRAQRFGTTAGLIDFGRHQIVPFGELLEELLGLVAEDAAALGCAAEVAALPALLADGTSAARQRQALEDAMQAGDSREEALRTVVRGLVDEFHVDL
ncbi:MAG: carboxylate-amine ligase [Limimaricola sp.]|uniref:carboxylate-amine ligase n=1 Tax=Limimaricola sp. TaxID=2211665 RepID=UPI001D775D32|nr:carboxylate-amine ligase [Limimaricola sp.]MBI1418387.1 carboxylate-amine ligase [Limimaricola sp.]